MKTSFINKYRQNISQDLDTVIEAIKYGVRKINIDTDRIISQMLC